MIINIKSQLDHQFKGKKLVNVPKNVGGKVNGEFIIQDYFLFDADELRGMQIEFLFVGGGYADFFLSDDIEVVDCP